MRCARCARDWAETTSVSDHPEPAVGEPFNEVPDPAVVEPAEPPDPVEAVAAPAHPPMAADAGVRFGWAGSALLLALGAWSVIAWRQDVMHAWPPSGRLYAALGLTTGR